MVVLLECTLYAVFVLMELLSMVSFIVINKTPKKQTMHCVEPFFVVVSVLLPRLWLVEASCAFWLLTGITNWFLVDFFFLLVCRFCNLAWLDQSLTLLCEHKFMKDWFWVEGRHEISETIYDRVFCFFFFVRVASFQSSFCFFARHFIVLLFQSHRNWRYSPPAQVRRTFKSHCPLYCFVWRISLAFSTQFIPLKISLNWFPIDLFSLPNKT